MKRFTIQNSNHKNVKNAKNSNQQHISLLFCVFSAHSAHRHGLLALPFQTQVHSSPDCITLTDEHSVKLELDLFI